jgi:GMP synthase-like glutamine amidotransferase
MEQTGGPKMRVHYLQHADYENLAGIEGWLKERGHKITRTKMHALGKLPRVSVFDWLIIMGGPMNIYEDKKYPWLKNEKTFIRKAIKAGKTVLGVCLGAQLLADSLGGKVTQNKYKEIGFFPVKLNKAGRKAVLFNSVKSSFPAIHLHGDTFSIPPGCKNLASTLGCKNQAFEYKGRVFGVQFHFEYSQEHMAAFFAHPENIPLPGKFVQSPGEIFKNRGGYMDIRQVMDTILFNVEKSVK